MKYCMHTVISVGVGANRYKYNADVFSSTADDRRRDYCDRTRQYDGCGALRYLFSYIHYEKPKRVVCLIERVPHRQKHC